MNSALTIQVKQLGEPFMHLKPLSVFADFVTL